VAAAALTAASAFSLASTGDGRLRLLSALVGMATMFAALPASRELATLLGDREARRLARSVADLGPPLTGAVRVTVWKVRGCPFCLYYESILRPGILEEFGEAIVLEEKEADYAWLPVPLIVVSGAVTIVFKSLPPEDEQGDRYHVLSAAVQAGGDQQFAALGRAGGLFVIDGRK
jgi:hypothetical protein